MKRSDRQWSILTANVTAWQRAEDLLSSFGPGRLQPDVFMVQEIAKTAREAKLLEGQLTNRKWQPQLVPSNVAPDKGKSAGVGLLASWSGTVAAYPVEDLGKRHPGRVAVSLWSGLLAHGVVVVSVYAHTGAEAQGLNADLLEGLARELNGLRLPFIAGGDWNMSPAALAATGFATRLKGIIVAPDATTYRSGGAESTLDFFVVSECLRPSAQDMRVIENADVPKRFPVELVLSGRPRAESVLTLARPPPRPAAAPIACAPQVREEERWAEKLPANFGDLDKETIQMRLDGRYREWAGKADAHIGSLYGMPPNELRGAAP